MSNRTGKKSSAWLSRLYVGAAAATVLAIASQMTAVHGWAQQPDAGAKAAEGLQQSLGAGAQQLSKPAPPVAPDDVVLTVGDTKITAAEFDRLLRTLPPDASQALASMGKKGFAERYVNLLTLAKEGEKRKVDQSEAFQQMTAFQRLMLLGQLTLNDIVTSMGEISADEVSYYYTAHQNEFQQVNLRGIYIPFESSDPGAPAQSKAPAAKTAKPKLTEAEAKAKADGLKLRIQAGEKMADLAKKESDHPTAAKGGDFGWVRRNQFAPQVDNVIFALDVNQVSVPVKDRFGYFIFQVDQKRNQPLDEVKQAIENALRQQKLGEALGKVQAQYAVEYNQHYFAEATPQMPATVAPAPAQPPVKKP